LPVRSRGGHLVLETHTLAPLIRWRPELLDWGIFIVASGAASLHDVGMTRVLEAGDVVALPAGSAACFTGAGKSSSRIHHYLVSLELLTGVFSHSERRRMVAIAARKQPLVRRFTVAEFVRLSAGDSHSSPSLMRCEMLRLLALLLADQQVDAAALARGSQTARERVADLLRQRPESVLVSHTVDELARFCGCSQRHFSRLFHETSGVCIRERQIQLRLEQAGQLLRESNVKIIEVAMDSGYRHLGLFNTMFKKRFGMTPGEWRRENLLVDRGREGPRTFRRQLPQ